MNKQTPTLEWLAVTPVAPGVSLRHHVAQEGTYLQCRCGATGQEVDKRPTPDYMTAMKAAINAVAMKEEERRNVEQ